LLAVVVIFVVANSVDQEQYPITEDWYPTDIQFIIIPSVVIILGLILIGKYKGRGNHGIAWILFTLAIVSWFVGELTYSYDYEYDIEDISTLTSDIFYILGYPLFFAFTVFYLRPRKRIITRKMILTASLVSLVFVLPTLYFTLDVEDDEVDELTMLLYAIYPILDAIILVPAIIAVILFFRGQVNFLWSLILLATIFDIIADSVYLVASIDDSYYPGHPIDIVFLWAYVLYAFGAYNHIKLYGKVDKFQDPNTHFK